MEHKYSQMTNALCGTFKPFVNQEAQAQFDAIKKHYFSRFHKEDADEIAQPLPEHAPPQRPKRECAGQVRHEDSRLPEVRGKGVLQAGAQEGPAPTQWRLR